MASIRKLPRFKATFTPIDGRPRTRSGDDRGDLEKWLRDLGIETAGTGSIDTLPTRYQAQIRPVAGGKQVTKTHEKRAVVQRWVEEQTAALVTGTYADPHAGRETLEHFYEGWSARQIWESSTKSSVDMVIRSCDFAFRPLRSITKAHVELWVKSMQVDKGLAPTTIRLRLSIVRTVMRGAIADRLLMTDPTLGVRLPRVQRKEAAMRIPTPKQVRSWIDASEPHWRALIALCAFAGLRLGEAAALRVSDVEFLRREITIARQAGRAPRGQVDIRKPKHGSERVVAAAPALLELLTAHITLLGLEREDWLFRGDGTGPAGHNAVAHAWRSAQARSAAKGYTLRDLRHFYASGLIAAGCDVSTVQHALGHSSPTITLGTYTHLWPKAEDRTRAAAQGLMEQAFAAADESLTNESTRSARFRA